MPKRCTGCRTSKRVDDCRKFLVFYRIYPAFLMLSFLPRLNNKAFRGVVTLRSARFDPNGSRFSFRLNDIGRWLHFLHSFPQLAGGITEILVPLIHET